MRYLIDTNILLYIIFERDKLSKEVYEIVEDYENSICVSSESLKELIHLFHIGKIRMRKWKKAQAITEKIPLISSDRKFEAYRNQNLNFVYNKR
ncbi:MAG: PIN domain-containing protein [Bacteroidales bacterium]|nr:PIN domain-containing protein [Bacteroidales bacterium]